MLRSHESGADGVVVLKSCTGCVLQPPRPLPIRLLRDIYLRSRPPLLTRRGIATARDYMLEPTRRAGAAINTPIKDFLAFPRRIARVRRANSKALRFSHAGGGVTDE